MARGTPGWLSRGVAALPFGVEFPSDPRLPVTAIAVAVSGTADLQLQHLLLDDNGGRLILVLSLVSSSCARPSINVRLRSSDAFGTLDDVAQQLGDLPINRVSRGDRASAKCRNVGFMDW